MAVIRGNTGAGDQRKVPNYRARNKTHQYYTIIYYYSIVRTTAILEEHHA